MKIQHSVSLIGDEIENVFNIEAMQHAAEMFGSSCKFRKSTHDEINTIEVADMLETFTHLIALDNWKNAHVLYGFQLPQHARAAIIAGNERRGISKEVANVATHAVIIPMISKQLNCINVAAASAVALYYMSNAFRGRMQIRKDPQKKRPELVLIGGDNHAELGSAIRSAAAFGWNRAFIEDRSRVWFGCDRITRSEGRAAARRGRNQIRLIPCERERNYLFREAVIVTTRECGDPLPKVDLAKGTDQIIVVPDESCCDIESENWKRIAEKHCFARIDIPNENYRYHYRHIASIAMAETSRQVGQREPGKPYKSEPLYQKSLELLSDAVGEEVTLDELSEY